VILPSDVQYRTTGEEGDGTKVESLAAAGCNRKAPLRDLFGVKNADGRLGAQCLGMPAQAAALLNEMSGRQHARRNAKAGKSLKPIP
jgi:hypothetical protein